jgi:hypothetical protein
MRALLELLCSVVGHRTPPGVRREMSIAFHCDRCGCIARGAFVPGRRA